MSAAHRRDVAGGNDTLEIFEGSHPVLVVLPVVGLVSGGGENLIRNRRVLEQKWRATPLKGRQRRISVVGRDGLDVQVRVDDVCRHLQPFGSPSVLTAVSLPESIGAGELGISTMLRGRLVRAMTYLQKGMRLMHRWQTEH